MQTCRYWKGWLAQDSSFLGIGETGTSSLKSLGFHTITYNDTDTFHCTRRREQVRGSRGGKKTLIGNHMNRTLGISQQLLLASGLGLILGGCSWVPKGVSQLDVGIEDRGLASWYGAAFHGKQAANGKPFDMHALTAAHRTFPLGSVVRVVNLANGKHLHVWITDRGPYIRNRIIDLSRAAAVLLGMREGGVSAVRVQVVGTCWTAVLFSSEAIERIA